MATVSVKRVVSLTAEQAFAIASDVNEYKDFLPLVTRSTIRGKVEQKGPIKRFAADMMISVDKLGMRDNFTSDVVADADARTVVATSQDGPMKDLRATWTIKPMDGSRCAGIDRDQLSVPQHAVPDGSEPLDGSRRGEGS